MRSLPQFVTVVVIIITVAAGAYLLITAAAGQPPPEPLPLPARPAGKTDRPAVEAKPVSLRLSAGDSGTLEHESGARMEIPQGALAEAVNVSISEVVPPDSPLKVSRAFDFSVGGAELSAPVTVHIPFEIEPSQDASSVHALHWDDEAVGWEPVPGVVDTAAGTIAVTTDGLSVFSWIWVKVEATCEASPAVMGTGDTLRAVSTVKNLGFLPIDIYMTPSVERVGDGVGDGSLGRSEVETVGSGESLDLTYETALATPGEYRVQCRIFFVTIRAGTELVSEELLSDDSPSVIVTVRRDGGPTAGADLWLDPIEDEDPTIYPGDSYNIDIQVRNVGGERSGHFDLVADFTSAAGGRTTRVRHPYPHEGMYPGSSSKQRFAFDVPDDMSPGRYSVCVRIAHTDGSEGEADGGCLDRYVLSGDKGAMDVRMLPVDTKAGERAWAALPYEDWVPEVLAGAVEFTNIEDDATLKSLYKKVAVELAFRRAVDPGVGSEHVLLQGLTENVQNGASIVGYITEYCGFECEHALNAVGLSSHKIMQNLPSGFGEAVSFGGQTVSGALLFGDVYFTVLVNQALDVEQALDTLNQLKSLPLGPIWKDAVEEAKRDVIAAAGPNIWAASASAIIENREDFLKFASLQTVSGLTKQLGLVGQQTVVHALGLKAGAGGSMLGGPAVLFVASVWFASEVYLSVETKKDQLGTAALAAFINAAFSDPSLRGDLLEAVTYAKYVAYDNLYESKAGWQQQISSWVKLSDDKRTDFLERMKMERDLALNEMKSLLSAESVEVDPDTVTLVAGEAVRLSASATMRSGRAFSPSGLEWTSDAPGIATVSLDGVVTSVSPGNAVITVRAGDAVKSAGVEVVAVEEPGPPDPPPDLSEAQFSLDWETSAVTVEEGESFTLTVRVHDVQEVWEHGGISASFPEITEAGGSTGRHSSAVADVEAVENTTGLSRVTFHQPGATIYHSENNRQLPAEYLLVESDDPSWSSSDDRTLVLRVTPKRGGDFPIQIRGWLCADEYTGCVRRPADGPANDQQGWAVERMSVEVALASETETLSDSTPAGSAPFARIPTADYDRLVGGQFGVWSDGNTMWVADARDNRIYAYDASTKTRTPDREISGVSASVRDIWSDGETMWVADWTGDRILAYNMTTKARVPDRELNGLGAVGNNHPEGIWSDGATMWVSDLVDDRIYAYDMATKERDADKEFDALVDFGSDLGDGPRGLWSDGVTMWIVGLPDSRIYAYDMATKARDPGREFDTLQPAGNDHPWGAWSDGTTLWVTDYIDGKIYAYNMPSS